MREDRLLRPVTHEDHVRGPDPARTTLLEYGDYQCPSCRALQPVLEDVLERSSRSVRFAFRHFPLEEHPRARTAAHAAEAAALQGEFWAMHDALFEAPWSLEEAAIRTAADDVGLDLARFEEDRDSERVRKRVEAQRRGGLESGVDRTPTLFIDGRRYRGRTDAQALLEAIVAAALGD